jgi:hypothetical protein
MKKKKFKTRILRSLQTLKLDFKVCQNKHMKMKLTNPETGLSTSLTVPVSPAGGGYEHYFWKQYDKHLVKIGVCLEETTKKKGETK